MPTKKVAVIGAGITGMVTAYKLSQKEHEVEIFEKSNKIGGLAGGFEFNKTNIEEYYHHIFKTDKDIINLINELGLSDKLIWRESPLAIYYENNIYPFSSPMDLLKFNPLNIMERVRLGVIIFYLQKTKSWKKFSSVTTDQWLRKMCGKRIYNIVWLPLLKGKFHDFYKLVSMSWFWARIHTRANSKDKGGFKEKLGYLKGGFQTLIDALKNNLERNSVKIHLDCEVEKIVSKNKSIQIFLSDGSSYEFRQAICTIPSPVFAELIKNNNKMPDNYLEQLKSIKYLGAICAVLLSEKSLSNYYWHNINDIDSPFLVFIQHTNFIDKSNYNNKHIYYLGTYLPANHKYFQQEDSVIYNDFFQYLKNIFPDFQKQDIIDKYLFKSKYAQHVVDCSYENKIPSHKTPIANVYLANFSQIFPEDRGMNFSVQEAIKISDLIKD